MLGFLRRGKAVARPDEACPPVIEIGSFAHGTCGVCDWKGPGRRARSTAIGDAQLHSVIEHEAVHQLQAV